LKTDGGADEVGGEVAQKEGKREGGKNRWWCKKKERGRKEIMERRMGKRRGKGGGGLTLVSQINRPRRVSVRFCVGVHVWKMTKRTQQCQ
jgi:hypothetical protein